MKEVGRNDPCPCGSGKKYKKCCALKPAMQKRTYTQMDAANVQASISRVTGVLSQTLRKTHPEAADKLDKVVKKGFVKPEKKEEPPKEETKTEEDSGVDPKS